MKEKILNNLDNTSEEDKNELLSVFDNDIDSYLVDNYYEILNEWKKKNPEFDIPCGVISICVNDKTKYFNIGNKYNENTIFDIASMSKLYTEIIFLDYIYENNISLDTKISDITDIYKNIGFLTLMDLIGFNNTFKTDINIVDTRNINDAKNALRSAYIVDEKRGYYLYTDLTIMILTDILEVISNKTYKELFQKYIIQKYDFKNTYLEISDVSNYVSINGKYINDPKANIFGGYYGHAGVKTSSLEFIRFLSSILSRKDSYLFINKSNTLNSDGLRTINKGLIGNANLSVKKDSGYTSLACNILPSHGFAIQGSVRCHAETCEFVIDDKKYIVTTSILLDIYTQKDNVIKYKNRINSTNNDYYYNYEIDSNVLHMVDVRKILPYDEEYGKLVYLIGKIRLIYLYNML